MINRFENLLLYSARLTFVPQTFQNRSINIHDASLYYNISIINHLTEDVNTTGFIFKSRTNGTQF